MKRLLTTALLGLVCTAALAAGTTPNATWNLPSLYSSGVALPPSDLASVTLEMKDATGRVLASKALPGTATSYVGANVCGTVYIDVFVTTTATALYPNASSTPTAAAQYASGIPCIPLPPANFKVQ